MLRTLRIDFCADKSVNYEFSRCRSEYEISEFLIEYPTEKVIIHETENLNTDNFNKTINYNNHFSLFWDKRKSSNLSKDSRIIKYTKLDYLTIYQDNPLILRYNEVFKIKGNNNKDNNEDTHVLYIHGVDRQISAIKKLSKSIFKSSSNGFTHTCNCSKYGCSEHEVFQGKVLLLKPSELIGIQFNCSGILEIDWYLELIEK